MGGGVGWAGFAIEVAEGGGACVAAAVNDHDVLTTPTVQNSTLKHVITTEIVREP